MGKQLLNMQNEINPVEDYCRKQGYRVSYEIESEMVLVVKPRVWWIPKFIYDAVIRQSVEIVHIN
jgi:hypothetical protein